jgi:hypothetical protein
MELIPILSLIILVATVSTFILAVGAYILFKLREKNKASSAPEPASIEAELVSPAPLSSEQRRTQTGAAGYYTGERQPTSERYYTGERVPTRETYEQQRQRGMESAPKRTQVQSPPPTRESFERKSTGTYAESNYARPHTSERKTSTESRRKFMRYTQEGYVEPDQEKKKKSNNKEEPLRWR